ncbi:MAG: Nitrate reductase molybdenum cofactor assembly chaperone [Candidatus Tokpelaia hoelldobleri]|uniref:Nitrate reductase molybdenum cofactor assembly chaperone n=1 Tax=Candidatus Tokpelaia hoelldobleri TaxID=1902579 RepID=A0A1U9JV66_9HYPH|nr:MAG: Nitrate reductase molybdenum cofactor assembly chaperone [Candidatus Tokpelaia hoelldoblerii]
MQTELKLLSLLLSYPQGEMRLASDELKAFATQSTVFNSACKTQLVALIDSIAAGDLFDVQAEYVTLFDRTRALSLHLFEHVHGESRDRGQAMVDLKTMYEEAGYEIDAAELPDYLPMFLEFLATQPIPEATASLGDIAHIVIAMGERLGKRQSPYAAIFTALTQMADGDADKALVNTLLEQEEDDPNDFAALDRIWEEEAITFGSNMGENSCGPDRLRTRLRAAHRDVAAPTQE